MTRTPPPSVYHTWRRSRGNRLPRGLYPAGRPIHATLCTADDGGPFALPRLAEPVYAALSEHPSTLAACLMPDHLHWLLDDAGPCHGDDPGFKSYPTRLARRTGYRGPLWQRLLLGRRRPPEREPGGGGDYLLDNPVRAGRVRSREEYPYSVVKPERLGPA